MRTRSILAAAVLGGLTIAPRCATNAGYEMRTPPAPVAAENVVSAPAPEPTAVAAPPPAATVVSAAPAAPPPVDAFRESVRPVLSARCGKCHDPGGRMYARLPFDDPGVVSSHGDRILGRLRGDDRAAVEKWLAGLAPAGAAR